MNEARLAIVRDAFAAMTRRDLELLFANSPPGYVLDLSESMGPGSGVYTGGAAAAGAFADFLEPWESVRWEPDVAAFVEIGDQFVTPFRNHFRGRDGIAVSAQGAYLWTFRGETVLRVKLFQDADSALAAARTA